MDEQNEHKVTRDDFNNLLYAVISDKIARLKKTHNREECNNIRNFLVKIFCTPYN